LRTEFIYIRGIEKKDVGVQNESLVQKHSWALVETIRWSLPKS
jgi:hypothetical protein